MICEFCNKELCSNSALNYHKKTAKYCLKLQGVEIKNNEVFTCEFCNKDFSLKHHLSTHKLVCKNKEKYELINKIKEELKEQFEKEKEELKEQFEKEKEELKKCFEKEKEELQEFFKKEIRYKENIINDLKVKEKIIRELQYKEDIISELKEEKSELKGQLMTLKDDHSVLKEIAKQPKHTTNNTLHITSSIDFDNIDKIKDVIDNDFNINYAIDGQKGVAKFVKEKLLQDDSGNYMYVCTDPSRQIFKYKDNKGEIKKDVEAKKLTNYIVDGGIKKKTIDVSNEWYTKEDGAIDMEKFNIMLEQQQDILKIEGNNNTFKKELAALII